MSNDWDYVFAERLTPLLPLAIRRAEWQEPSLTFGDETWSVAINSAWRVADGGGVLFGWSTPSAADKVWELCGLEVVSVGCDRRLDPSLGLSNGWRLDVFSDDWHDPWTIRLPALTLVGDART